MASKVGADRRDVATQRTGWWLVVLAALLCVVSPGRADEEVPFPVKRSTILRKQGTKYFIEGRQKIPKGVEISCQKDVYIRGRGKDAVLEVQGSLQAHGVKDREIIFENVWIEMAPKFEDVHLDMCKFRKSAGVRASRERPVDGKLFIENVWFEESARLDVALSAGSVDLSNVRSRTPVTITALDPSPTKRNKVRINVRNCYPKLPLGNFGFDKGLVIENGDEVIVRLNRMEGERSAFVNCRNLMFDGNKVTSKTLEFRQSEHGHFRKTKMLKCDIYSESLVVSAPIVEGKPEKLKIDKCWFQDLLKPKEIHDHVVTDAADDEKCGVRVVFKKILKRPLELAGSANR